MKFKFNGFFIVSKKISSGYIFFYNMLSCLLKLFFELPMNVSACDCNKEVLQYRIKYREEYFCTGKKTSIAKEIDF